MAATLRPMRAADAEAVDALKSRTFADLDLRSGRTPRPGASPEAAQRERLARLRHLVATDPDGTFVAERDGAMVGAAVALLRDGLWGLSLLVVDPEQQSSGVGTHLLGATLAYGADAHGGVILASEDSRALRAYARAGFAMHPSIEAAGVPRPLEAPRHVRPGDDSDLPLADAVDRAVRGVPHGTDLRRMLEHGAQLLVAPGRGYACVRGGEVALLAAYDEPAAADLLRAAIASTPAGVRAVVDWITSAQGWAMPVVLDAGLELTAGGAVFLRGDTGRFSPYLPSGAYL